MRFKMNTLLGKAYFYSKCPTAAFSFQGVLCQVQQSTKAVLNLLGVFTVSSFHAYICARSPSLLSNLLAGRGASRKRPLSANNTNYDGHASIERQNSAGTNKSYDEDDDFNESSLVHVKVPGKKVSLFSGEKRAPNFIDDNFTDCQMYHEKERQCGRLL